MTAAQRYALATDKDTEAGLIWSTGGVWSANVPELAKLMTGPEVDQFAERQPGTTVVDVVVYRAMCDAYGKGFNSVHHPECRSTPESRAAAREAGRVSLRAAGYVAASEKANPFNPCTA